MYRLVVLDIDGTLLNEQGHVTPHVRAAIRRALKAGVHVTLATGRRLWSVRQIVAELGLRLPVILYSGALIWDTATQDALYQRPLTTTQIHNAVLSIRERGAQVVAFPSPMHDPEEHLIFGPEDDDDEIGHAYAVGRIRRVLRMSYAEIETLPGIIYLAVVSSAERVAAIYESLSPCSQYTLQTGVNNPQAEPPWHAINIYTHGVSKAAALVHLAQRYGLNMADTMAIGDGNNDLELIETAGFGVAMGNARSHLKERADVVVGSNAEDGVAEAIERFVLGKRMQGDLDKPDFGIDEQPKFPSQFYDE